MTPGCLQCGEGVTSGFLYSHASNITVEPSYKTYLHNCLDVLLVFIWDMVTVINVLSPNLPVASNP